MNSRTGPTHDEHLTSWAVKTYAKTGPENGEWIRRKIDIGLITRLCGSTLKRVKMEFEAVRRASNYTFHTFLQRCHVKMLRFHRQVWKRSRNFPLCSCCQSCQKYRNRVRNSRIQKKSKYFQSVRFSKMFDFFWIWRKYLVQRLRVVFSET